MGYVFVVVAAQRSTFDTVPAQPDNTYERENAHSLTTAARLLETCFQRSLYISAKFEYVYSLHAWQSPPTVISR